MDIIIWLLLALLVVLHCLFGYKAIRADAKIKGNQRFLWCILSLCLGPAGYYSFLGLIPCELIGRD